jgi:RNA polymerase sigma-70 factor (ECF subfamily)
MSASTNYIDPHKWVDKYSDYLFNYTIVRVNDREVAHDLISETFLAGLKSMKNFKGEATERTWLISILKRKIIDYYRKINSRKGRAEIKINYSDESNEGDWLEEMAPDRFDKTAEDNMENEELGLAILNCMENLTEKQARIFKMKTIEGFETEAICNEFNITPSNLWVIIHRARTTLAGCLEKNWF